MTAVSNHNRDGMTAAPPPPVGPSDVEAPEAVLERAARGDTRALLELYDRFAPALMAVALRITGSRAEAEDVVQEAMTRAWREASTFDRGRGSAAAWLVTLTRNRAIDVVRSRRRREDHHKSEVESPPELGATPEAEVSSAERAVAVRQAIAVLTADQRAVLDLAYFSGLSHSEIAEKLNQPLGTVKTRIAQAVRRLREELSRFGPGAGHGAPAEAT